MVREAADRLGGLDIILTAAAAIYRRPILEISDAEWDHMAALNLRGTFACATEAARLMRAGGKGGRIILIGSVVQQVALKGQVAYGAGKAAIAQLARGMALELAGDGITVNVIAPGATLTDFNRHHLADPNVRASREAAVPMGRLGTPEDMAEAAVYLASDGAAYTTGVTIFVDGGLVLP
jgi:NAD(P)-dependent dehydrogenase (short-subunit alcohol dehydrogenase family)